MHGVVSLHSIPGYSSIQAVVWDVLNIAWFLALQSGLQLVNCSCNFRVVCKGNLTHA